MSLSRLSLPGPSAAIGTLYAREHGRYSGGDPPERTHPVIKRTLMFGAGAAAGWLGRAVYQQVRRAEQDAQAHPTLQSRGAQSMGRQAGQAAAAAAAATVRGFTQQLRSEVPSWRSVGESEGQASAGASAFTQSRSASRDTSSRGTSSAQGFTSAENDAARGDADARAARREALQGTLRDVAANTDWRSVSEAVSQRNWGGAATTLFSTGVMGRPHTVAQAPASADTVPGTVTEEDGTQQAGSGADRRSRTPRTSRSSRKQS